MKLYAKIESERASKGQGGNEYLDIDIFVGNATEPYQLGAFTLRPHEDGYALFDEEDRPIRYVPEDAVKHSTVRRWFGEGIKGNNQKGEK